MKFDDLYEINGEKLTKKYIQSLKREERELLIKPLYDKIREVGLLFPDDYDKAIKEWGKIKDMKVNVDDVELYNNSSAGSYICKYFCQRSFYGATDTKSRVIFDLFNDDEFMLKLVKNRLGLLWNDGSEESFNISPKMILQGMRSMRAVSQVTMFKFPIAKYVYMKYSKEGDVVFDPSAGFGGRLMGAMSCGRKYIGVDPLTIPELYEMGAALSFKDFTLIQNGSEFVKLDENSIDLAFTSPPYYNLEVYSKDDTQAYNKGEDYFYNVYWKTTLENIKYMLKPGKKFVLNVKEDKMIEMAKDMFKLIEDIGLKTVKSHLNKRDGNKDNAIKYEYMYVLENDK